MFTSEKLFASYFETFSNGYTENSRITIVTTCWKSSCKLAMALLCFEQEFIPRSFADKTILNDKRVMENLLAAEDLYTLSSDYFANRFQADIRPNMRKTVVEWMFEVCDEQRCEEEVFHLAVNYLDRYLASVKISRLEFQLVGVACMFLASKLKETVPMTAEKLVIYTDNSITLEQLVNTELDILHTLKWDLSAVTPQDFLPLILHRLPVTQTQAKQLRNCAQTFVALCAFDFNFARNTPSTLAASSISASAAHLRFSIPDLTERLHQITHIEVEYLRECRSKILSMAQQLTEPEVEASAVTQKPEKEVDSLPTTPTDVHGVDIFINASQMVSSSC